MKKLKWLVPAAIVIILAIAWHTLPTVLESHFDAQGNASSTMPRYLLLLYPVVAAIPCLFRKLNPLSAMCFSMIVLCSCCVSITCGRYPVFMYLEPVFLVAALIFLFWRKRS